MSGERNYPIGDLQVPIAGPGEKPSNIDEELADLFGENPEKPADGAEEALEEPVL